MSEDERGGAMPDEAVMPRSDGPALRLTLAAAMSAVETGRRAILDHLAPLALDERVINRIEVIFEELVGNLVRHGAVDSIALEIGARVGEIELVFEDAGPEFNPLELTTPSRFTTLEEAEVGGLGIPLVRRLSRSLRYERVEEEPALNRVVVTIAR
jgi:anti-sigma regulatory factor (Ser/Thr protein kinase)